MGISTESHVVSTKSWKKGAKAGGWGEVRRDFRNHRWAGTGSPFRFGKATREKRPHRENTFVGETVKECGKHVPPQRLPS